MQPTMIKIDEIDADVIDSIRVVDTKSEEYEILASSIAKDGQSS